MSSSVDGVFSNTGKRIAGRGFPVTPRRRRGAPPPAAREPVPSPRNWPDLASSSPHRVWPGPARAGSTRGSGSRDGVIVRARPSGPKHPVGLPHALSRGPHAQRGFDTPSPAAHLPQSGFDTPSPAAHLPQSGFDTPSPAAHSSQSGFDTPSLEALMIQTGLGFALPRSSLAPRGVATPLSMLTCPHGASPRLPRCSLARTGRRHAPLDAHLPSSRPVRPATDVVGVRDHRRASGWC